MNTKRRRTPRKSRAQGQALTEFLVVAVVLTPLFLLIPLIAKYQNIAHTTQMASRYAAFDSLVRNDAQNAAKPITQLQEEVRRRFYSNGDAPIQSNDVAQDVAADQNAFWRTPDGKPLIAHFADVTVSRNAQQVSNTPGHFGATADAGSATVSVQLANLSGGIKLYEPFDHLNLSISRSTSVLTDGWTARNTKAVTQRLLDAAFIPATAILPPLYSVVEPAIRVAEPGVTPPKLGTLDYWRDDVPRDRLRAFR